MTDQDAANLKALEGIKFTKPLVLDDVVSLYELVVKMTWNDKPKVDCYTARVGVVLLRLYFGGDRVWSREYEAT